MNAAQTRNAVREQPLLIILCLTARPETQDASHNGSEQPRLSSVSFSLETGIKPCNVLTHSDSVLVIVYSSPVQGGRDRDGEPLNQFRDQGQIYIPVKKGQSLSLSPWVHIPAQDSTGTWAPAWD